MKKYIEITDVVGREVLDSRGNPTVEVEVYAMDASRASCSWAAPLCPPAPPPAFMKPASCGTSDKSRYMGKGVHQGRGRTVNTEIAECLMGMNVLDQPAIDKMLIELDGTPNKTRLGANAILGASLACAKARSRELWAPASVQLYRRRATPRPCPCP